MPPFQPRNAGEQLLQRPLETEQREGVTHFKPGQMRAVCERTGTPGVIAGIASWVNPMGQAVVVISHRARRNGISDEEGDPIPTAWTPVARAMASQTSGTPLLLVPPGYELNDTVRQRLAAAERALLRGKAGK